jgi:hypothetical protein
VTEKEQTLNRFISVRCRKAHAVGWALLVSAACPLAGIAVAADAAAVKPPPAAVETPSPAAKAAVAPAPTTVAQANSVPAPAATVATPIATQAAPPVDATPPAPVVSPTPGEPAPPAAADTIPSLEAPPPLPELPALPDAPLPPAKRMKSLRITTGAAPTAVDLGSEADITAGGGRGEGYGVEDATDSVNKGWWYSLKGYVRTPMRLSLGPRNDATPGLELHSPPRVPGQGSGDWTYLAIASNPVVNLYATVGNSRLSANVILSSGTVFDSGYQDLDQLGGINSAYVTLKFPDAFGTRGGLAWTAGNFSMRYGNAGPGERSSGYYGSYLFGRTHTAGEDLTADIDITDRIELTVEHAIGAMIEPVPYDPMQKKNGFLPTATTNEGSTFVHHAHALVAFDDWLRVGAHVLTCWTPNDHIPPVIVNGKSLVSSKDARMTVWGADVHVDGLGVGSGYLGFSHTSAENLYYLGPALQVVHGTSGTGFRNAYFGRKDGPSNLTPTNDKGTVDSVLFQYIVRLGKLLGKSPIGRDTSIGLFGMYNHVRSPPQMGVGHDPLYEININEHKLKVGAEIEVAAHKYLNIGLRYDRVMPSLTDRDPSYWAKIVDGKSAGSDAFSAISPRLIIHTNWKSKEYVIVDYTHYFLGPRAYPGSPYSTIYASDPNMLSITALLSF